MKLRSVRWAAAMLVVLAPAVAAAPPAPDEIAALPRCEALQGAARTGWQRVTMGDRTIELPADFKEVEGVRFVHGGTSWAQGERQASASWGMWGLSSFGDPPPRACRISCRGLAAVRLDFADAPGGHLGIWLRGSGEPHELVVSAWSKDPEDGPLVQAIVASVCEGGSR